MTLLQRLGRLLISLAVGGFIFFLGIPEGLSWEAWFLLSVFIFTIVGIILKAMPMGAMGIFGMTLLAITNTLTFQEVFSGFHNHVVWLIVIAFFIARGFIKTGLGLRIAYQLMYLLGKNTKGLAYGLVFTDFILAPAIPSVTARAGGVVYPVVTALAKAFGSEPHNGPRKLGAYLVQTAFQAGVVSSAMFLTAMAGNPLVAELASESGITITWGSWALAAIVPGLISLLVMPHLMSLLYPPEIKNTPNAKAFSREELKKLGPMSVQEWVMVFVFALLIALWISGPYIHMKAVVAALVGICILLLSSVLSWEDVIKEKGAWDTLVWFSALVMMGAFLNKFGITGWFSQLVVSHLQGMHWIPGFLTLLLVYFYSHYFFASNVAHIGAMYAPFLVLGIALGAPPVLAALLLGFSSSLFGGLTHYGCGPAPIFFGSGYVKLNLWWKLGLYVSVVNLIIWIVLGGIWWKVIGLF
ncbi:MAG: anion permease [Simkaniaceae bacterium]|nr:anion permease [Simkaniaceae bacterium]